jgi:CBS domain-containing protein
MQIHEIMTQTVESAHPSLPILKAAEKMRDLDIGFLPICENDKLVGTVTDRDITIKSVAQGRDPRVAPVSEIMRPEVFFCCEDDDVYDVAQQMQEKEVRRMVILSRDRRLVGVVSLGDIAAMLMEKEVAGETLSQIAEAA